MGQGRRHKKKSGSLDPIKRNDAILAFRYLKRQTQNYDKIKKSDLYIRGQVAEMLHLGKLAFGKKCSSLRLMV